MSEEIDYLKKARAGDQTAFNHIVVTHQTSVYNLTYRMLGNAAEAEEAAQEAFLRAYIHLNKYDMQRPFRTWLLSIASHYCIDRIRKRRITWLPLEEERSMDITSHTPNPERAVSQKEQEEQIQSLLETLAPVDRAAVTLLYWYDCSYEEIAATLDLTVSAVKSRLYRARRALAETIGEKNYAV